MWYLSRCFVAVTRHVAAASPGDVWDNACRHQTEAAGVCPPDITQQRRDSGQRLATHPRSHRSSHRRSGVSKTRKTINIYRINTEPCPSSLLSLTAGKEMKFSFLALHVGVLEVA